MWKMNDQRKSSRVTSHLRMRNEAISEADQVYDFWNARFFTIILTLQTAKRVNILFMAREGN